MRDARLLTPAESAPSAAASGTPPAVGPHGAPRAEQVSAVLTCYNAGWCIERALDSVMGQTRVPGEIVISDDGSTDDTVERVTRRYGDSVRLLRLAHRGLTPSRIAAIQASTGSWIALMDADDTWTPEKLERQLAFLAHHPELRWLSSDGTVESADGRIAESWLAAYFDRVEDRAGDLFVPLVQRCFPLVSSSLIHRTAYDAVGGFDPTVEFSQDYALWLKLAARFPGGLMRDRLTTYWTSANQLSKRIEERYRDDKRQMEAVARGALRRDPEAQRVAREKVASYEFDLGVICLRSGRFKEGQAHLWRAALGGGPLRRRMLALFGAIAPRGSLRRLMRSPWLKHTVHGSRRVNPIIDGAGAGER